MRKRVLIGGIVTAGVVASALVIAASLFIRRFDAIESAQTLQKAQQILQAMEADLNQLAISTRDYAEWDDAHAYVRSGNPQFIEANFSIDSLSGMKVDLVGVIDPSGKMMYSAERFANQKELSSPVRPELLQIIEHLRRDPADWRRRASIDRIIGTSMGPLAFSMVEVNLSDKSDPTGSLMIFARFLDADDVTRVSQTSQLPVTLLPADSPQPKAVREWISSAHPQPVLGLNISDTQALSSALLRDIHGRPSLLLQSRTPREIATLGRRTTWMLMSAIGAVLLICAGVLSVFALRLKKSWEAQASIERRHRDILSHLDEIVVLADACTGTVIEANEKLWRTLGYRREDDASLSVRNVFVDLPESSRGLAVDAADIFDCRLRTRDGRLLDYEVSVADFIADGRVMVCLVARDVSQRRQAEQSLLDNQNKLAHLAEHDPLTDLPNRVYLQNRLPALLQQCISESRRLALLYIDLDHFKNVNDSRNHAVGDQLLKILAGRLQKDTSPGDLVIRSSGDEFVVVAQALQGPLEVKALASKLLAAVRAPILIDDSALSISASIGVAVYPECGHDAESLLKHADIALYRAKELGRDNFQLFEADMNAEVSEHVAIEQALRRALGTAQIYLEFQPVVDLRSGLLTSFEALARWKHPEMGVISPGRFIPVAEKSGLILPLGEQIVRSVIEQLDEWQRADVPLVPVAVNVAPLQFERTDFSTLVHELALDHNLDPQWLSFEVTESAWMQNSNKHVVTIDTLRHAGSKVYIDDFGTGFSNLSYLKNLPIDAVKIDQGFVRNLMVDISDAAIVSGILAMASQLNLDTIAEGIETAEQAEKLRQMGCHRGQGYYFSKPVPAAQCRALLEQMGELRRFTETLKVRAFRRAEDSAKKQNAAPAA